MRLLEADTFRAQVFYNQNNEGLKPLPVMETVGSGGGGLGVLEDGKRVNSVGQFPGILEVVGASGFGMWISLPEAPMSVISQANSTVQSFSAHLRLLGN